MGKKKHRPKSKAELLQERWKRERTRPPRPAGGWMQAAAERANRAQAEIAKKGVRENERVAEAGRGCPRKETT